MAGSGFTKSETAPWVTSHAGIGLFALRLEADAAERLTVELARRAGGDKSAGASAELPKIEGKMLPQKSN